ncbi:MAG: hypothetical protein HY042_08240 [Spirochaetia bacterium]|nr:hypothetical protein [Spirochaetia bacterium]
MNLLFSTDCAPGLRCNKKNPLLLALLVLSCSGSHPLTPLPLPESGEPFAVSYAEQTVWPRAGGTLDPAPALGDPFEERRILHASQPGFHSRDNLLCFTSQSAFFFNNEAGLRVSVCVPDADSESAARRAREIVSASSPGTPPVVSGPLRLEVLSLNRVKELGIPVLSVDGASTRAMTLVSDLGIQAASAWEQKSPLAHDTIHSVLARRFAVDSFHLLVYEDRAVFLYPAGPNWLAITLRGTKYVEGLLTGLASVTEIHERLFATADNAPARVTEAYFTAQGAAPFVEIAGDGAGSSLVRFDTAVTVPAAGVISREAFLFSKAVIVMDQDPASVNAGEPLAYDALKSGGASKDRSFTRDALDTLRPAWICADDAPCASRGIHPDYVRPLAQTESNQCTPKDFELSEMNPFGVKVRGRFDSGGKFLEFRARRSCQNGRVLFSAGKSFLDPGWGAVREGQILLFAADQSVFQAEAWIASDLRSFSPTDSVTAFDAADDTTHNLYVPDNAVIVPGSKSGGAFRSAHSILISRQGDVRMHPHTCRGLLPELEESHAMTPGYDEDEPSEEGAPLFSELLPMGSVGPDGPHADDEFIEFLSDERLCMSGGFDLAIVQNGNLRTFRFPPPCVRTGLFTIIRGTPACFTQGPDTNVIPQLSLPNGAAVYTTRAGRLLSDSVTIDSALYSSMNAGSTRRSLSRQNGVWRVSFSSGAALCPNTTFADPGIGGGGQ